jgi:Tubulin-tyrosine ligase family
MDENLVTQKYLYNPFTVDGGHKFDFRIYMIVVSVDPLIIYYHDGFLRVSLFKYDKHEMNRGAHLTNTELAKEIFKKVEEEGGTHMGMDINQLREFQMRTLPTF